MRTLLIAAAAALVALPAGADEKPVQLSTRSRPIAKPVTASTTSQWTHHSPMQRCGMPRSRRWSRPVATDRRSRCKGDRRIPEEKLRQPV